MVVFVFLQQVIQDHLARVLRSVAGGQRRDLTVTYFRATHSPANYVSTRVPNKHPFVVSQARIRRTRDEDMYATLCIILKRRMM